MTEKILSRCPPPPASATPGGTAPRTIATLCASAASAAFAGFIAAMATIVLPIVY